jgi:hypothetical protein
MRAASSAEPQGAPFMTNQNRCSLALLCGVALGSFPTLVEIN